MALQNLCPPALVYLVFSIVQIVIDIGRGYYNTAFAKIIVATIFAILLNYLCMLGLGIVSWVIVFLPFIFMSVIISVLLYVLGLKPTSGKLKVYKGENGITDKTENARKKCNGKTNDQQEEKINKKIFDKTNKLIEKQRSKIEDYKTQIDNLSMGTGMNIGSNIVPPHVHGDSNNRSLYGVYEINNKMINDKEIKKLRNALKAKNMRNKKDASHSLDIDYEDDINYEDEINFTKITDKDINKSIDTMLDDLKKRYN